MGVRRRDLVPTVLVLALAIGILGFIQPAFAVTTTISDQASCENPPINGVWDGLTSTCTVSANLSISAGDELIIASGVTLEMGTNFNLVNRGTVTNSGTIELTGTSGNNGWIDNRNGGTFTNSGTIEIDGSNNGGRILNRNTSTFTNSGTIEMTGLSGSSGRLINQNTATFTNLASGTIELIGTSGNGARLTNSGSALFTNFGTIEISGVSNSSGRVVNQGSATFTNSGTIEITGTDNSSGRLQNRQTATFTNSGSINLTGANNTSGRFLNQNSATFTNSGSLTITGTNNNSGQFFNQNASTLTNSGSFLVTGSNNNSGNVSNSSTLINSGTFTVSGGSNFSNTGSVQNNCGTITISGTQSGTPFEEQQNCFNADAGKSTVHPRPTMALPYVEQAFCFDLLCLDVESLYTHLELQTIDSNSVHTISTTVYCAQGVEKCNYVAIGGSPPGTNMNSATWKIILEKSPNGTWSMTEVDPNDELGTVTATVQKVNDNKHIQASFTIEFVKPSVIGSPQEGQDLPEGNQIINVELRDVKGGYTTYIFNEGVFVNDIFAYPKVNSNYEPPLEVESLCHNEDPTNRFTCAFEKVREWTTKNAEIKLQQILDKN